MAGIGLGGFIFPPLIGYLEYTYGWRGALLIVSAINLHLVVLGALYRPIKAVTDHPLSKEPQYSLKQSLHLHIFKNVHYTLYNLQAMVGWFAVSVVYVHLATYIQYVGYSHKEATFAVSVMGITNCVGRLIWGLISQHNKVTHMAIYFICYMITGVCLVITPLYNSYSWLVMQSGMFGLFSGVYGVAMPQLIVETLGIKLFSVGLGYQYTLTGLAVTAGPPVAGNVPLHLSGILLNNSGIVCL